jgi:hypothetical protein
MKRVETAWQQNFSKKSSLYVCVCVYVVGRYISLFFGQENFQEAIYKDTHTHTFGSIYRLPI